jgi:uncharacterized membrane protein YbhN (UPF0104 family)
VAVPPGDTDLTGSDRELPVAAAGSSRRQSLLRLVRVLGIAIAVLAIFLLVRTLVRQWSSISKSLSQANVGLLLLAFLVSAIGMWFLALLWRQCLKVFGDSRPIPTVSAWYFAGELGKYLPGGIWPVVGRGELARRGGVSRSVAYASTLISMGAMCIGGALTCGLVAPIVAIQAGRVGAEMLLLILVPLGVAVVHPAVFSRLLALAAKVTRGRIDLTAPPWGRMLALVIVSVPAWVGIGFSSVLTAAALGLHQQPARLIFAAVAAWIIGFLAVPVPAGAGIRELIFVAVCGLASAPATAVAALTRVMLVLVDGLGGIAGLLILRSRNNATARLTTRNEVPQ